MNSERAKLSKSKSSVNKSGLPAFVLILKQWRLESKQLFKCNSITLIREAHRPIGKKIGGKMIAYCVYFLVYSCSKLVTEINTVFFGTWESHAFRYYLIQHKCRLLTMSCHVLPIPSIFMKPILMGYKNVLRSQLFENRKKFHMFSHFKSIKVIFIEQRKMLLKIKSNLLLLVKIRKAQNKWRQVTEFLKPSHSH